MGLLIKIANIDREMCTAKWLSFIGFVVFTRNCVVVV